MLDFPAFGESGFRLPAVLGLFAWVFSYGRSRPVVSDAGPPAAVRPVMRALRGVARAPSTTAPLGSEYGGKYGQERRMSPPTCISSPGSTIRPNWNRNAARRIAGLPAAGWAVRPALAAVNGANYREPVWHCAVRATPEDRLLSDAGWAQVADAIMDRTGLAPEGDDLAVRWVAVRHAPDHIHLVAMLARQDRAARRHHPVSGIPRRAGCCLRPAARGSWWAKLRRRAGLESIWNRWVLYSLSRQRIHGCPGELKCT